MAITRNAVVGVFENEAAARRAVDNLVNSGFNRNDIHLGSSSDFTMDAASGGAGLTGRAPTEHHGGGFTGWLRSLFGDHDDERSDSDYYAQELQRGRCVVAVDTDDDNRDRAIDVLNDEGAIDVDQNAASGTYTGTGMNTGTGAVSPAGASYETGTERARTDTGDYARNAEYGRGTEFDRGTDYNRSGESERTGKFDRSGNEEQRIPVVQEELRVGKRVVQRGGVRVYTHVIEEPAQQDVTLREENVRVERRPADRAVKSDDAVMRDQSIEVTTTAEEPVIEKKARVVEEVVVSKDTTERKETVRDNVRRTKVETEPIGETNVDPGSGKRRNRS